MQNPHVLRWTALAIGLFMLGGVVWGIFPAVGGAFLLGGLIAVGGALLPSLMRLKRDPYSLEELQRVHEKAELEEIEAVYNEDTDMVLCLSCGNPYDRRFPTCPFCAAR